MPAPAALAATEGSEKGFKESSADPIVSIKELTWSFAYWIPSPILVKAPVTCSPTAPVASLKVSPAACIPACAALPVVSAAPLIVSPTGVLLSNPPSEVALIIKDIARLAQNIGSFAQEKSDFIPIWQ